MTDEERDMEIARAIKARVDRKLAQRRKELEIAATNAARSFCEFSAVVKPIYERINVSYILDRHRLTYSRRRTRD